MKLHINLEIEITPEELKAALTQDFDEFRVKVKPEKTDMVKTDMEKTFDILASIRNQEIEVQAKESLVNAGEQIVKEAREWSKPKKKVDWKKYYKSSANRDKICIECKAAFRDETRTNTRKWCDKCSLTRSKVTKPETKMFTGVIVDVAEAAKAIEERMMSKPEVKNPNSTGEKQHLTPTKKKELILTEPANGKHTVFLRIGEHICANKDCKAVFKANKVNQKYCTVKCEAAVKHHEFVH